MRNKVECTSLGKSSIVVGACTTMLSTSFQKQKIQKNKDTIPPSRTLEAGNGQIYNSIRIRVSVLAKQIPEPPSVDRVLYGEIMRAALSVSSVPAARLRINNILGFFFWALLRLLVCCQQIAAPESVRLTHLAAYEVVARAVQQWCLTPASPVRSASVCSVGRRRWD